MKSIQPTKVNFIDKYEKQLKTTELVILIAASVSFILHLFKIENMIDMFSVSGLLLFLIYFLWSYKIIPLNKIEDGKKINIFLSDSAYFTLVKITKTSLSLAYFLVVIYVSGFNDSLLKVIKILSYFIPALLIFNVLYKVYGKPMYDVAYWSLRIIICSAFLYYFVGTKIIFF